MRSTDTLFASGIRWLYCLPCRRPFELTDGEGSCECGRSRARMLDDGVELRGPVKALAPLDTIVRADGAEWTLVPEEITVRRRPRHAA